MTTARRSGEPPRDELERELDIDWDAFDFERLFVAGPAVKPSRPGPPEQDKYRLLLEIARALSSTLTLEDLLAQILDVVLQITRMEKGFLMLREEDGRFRLRVARNLRGEDVREEHFTVSRSIIKEVARSQRPIYLADIEKALAVGPEPAEAPRAVVCFPLKASLGAERPLRNDPTTPERRPSGMAGLIYVESPLRLPEFPAIDVELIEALACQAAVAIENAQLYARLELDRMELTGENVELRREVRRRYAFDNLVGQGPSMRELNELIARVARSDVNVLLRGESGTGKEIVAKTIHYNSRRAKGPFVSINCAALPEGLLESELFGIEPGVATGVVKRHGKLEQAEGGSFFLDEIGDMSPALQAKLLRVLETRQVERVGGRTTLAIDVRFIAATHRNLESAVAAGTFREDLYYRLNVVPIALPPLRARREDIPLLVEHFLHKHGDEKGVRVDGVTREALAVLVDHAWPGNVRQLENVIQRALVLADSTLLDVDDLPDMSDGPAALIDSGLTEGWTVDRLVKEYAVRVLERNKQNLTRTARELGVDFKTLKKKMEEFRAERGA